MVAWGARGRGSIQRDSHRQPPSCLPRQMVAGRDNSPSKGMAVRVVALANGQPVPGAGSGITHSTTSGPVTFSEMKPAAVTSMKRQTDVRICSCRFDGNWSPEVPMNLCGVQPQTGLAWPREAWLHWAISGEDLGPSSGAGRSLCGSGAAFSRRSAGLEKSVMNLFFDNAPSRNSGDAANSVAFFERLEVDVTE